VHPALRHAGTGDQCTNELARGGAGCARGRRAVKDHGPEDGDLSVLDIDRRSTSGSAWTFARGRLADEKLALLREPLTGEMVFDQGRGLRLTPSPVASHGPLFMGAAAWPRRVGQVQAGLARSANAPGMQGTCEPACRSHRHEHARIVIHRCFVGDDVEPMTSKKLGRTGSAPAARRAVLRSICAGSTMF
jgi:hypothetical protein